MIIAALLGALTFGACVDSQESASVEAVRNAKAEQLKSIATLNNAKAQAEATLAAAQAQLLAAQAQLTAAEAAALNATTEAQKIANQIAAAEAAQKIAEIEFAMEKAALYYEIELIKAQIQFNKDADLQLVALYNAYTTDLGELNKLKSDLVAAQKKLAGYQDELFDATEGKAELIAAYEATVATQTAKKTAYEAELAAVKELATADMTWAQMVDYASKAQEKLDAAKYAKQMALVAEAAALEAHNATLKPAYGADSDYMIALYMFEILYGGVDPEDSENVWPVEALPATGTVTDDGVEYIAFKTKKWDIATPGLANDDEINLFSVAKETDDKVDFNGDDATETELTSAEFTAYSYTPAVTPAYAIVAENVEAYAAEAEKMVEEVYGLRLEQKKVLAAKAKAEFEQKNADKISNSALWDNYVADYQQVLTKIAYYEAQVEAAQRVLAKYGDLADDFEAWSTIEKEKDYTGTMPYSYYKQLFNVIVPALEDIEEAKIWLDGNGTDDDKETVGKAVEKFLAGLANNKGIYKDDYAYSSTNLNALKDGIETYYFDTVEFADGNIVGDSNVFGDYFTAIADEAEAQANYDTAVEVAAAAVECLNFMVEEYENYYATMVTDYNAIAAAYCEAAYNSVQAAANVAAVEAKIDFVSNYIAFYDGDDTTVPTGYPESEYDAERILSNKIAELQKNIDACSSAISTANGEIKKLNNGTTAASKEALIATQEAKIADLELQIAVAEANLAVTKAALDAALAE